MLQLSSLEVVNFGPFKDKQTVAFNPKPGVSIFYGDNMRGKTSLLNAIRFALFGKVLGRGQRDVAFENLMNLEARAAGERHFEVSLELSHARGAYRLTRTGKPGPAGDYVTGLYLERGGQPLSPEQALHEIEQILPKDIARFFLFDGELLQEYEDLLHTDSGQGPQIRAAIERILGVPILTGARDSAKAALERAETALALAAQGDLKTREFGTQLQTLAAERDVFVADQARLESDLERLRGGKAELEAAMRRRERFASLLEKRDRLADQLKAAEKKLETSTEAMAKAMAPAWAALIRTRLMAAADALGQREATLQAAVTRAQVLHDLAQGHNPDCPTCLQKVDAKAQGRIRDALSQGADGGDAESQRELAAVRRRLEALQSQIAAANPEALRLLWQGLEDLRNEIIGLKGQIDDIAAKIGGETEKELRNLSRDYDSIVRQIVATEEGLSATQSKLADNAVYRENIQKRLEKLAGGQMETERRRRDLAAQVHGLFEKGVDAYREQLREVVEATATAFFLKMTTEKDYAGLRINEDYGLTILHKDGSVIPVRSAGAEHVVALSLVAALQNNAPMRGPIFIDSPFGRLDGGHRKNIVQTLPEMADQVVLLVYEDELPGQVAHDTLKGDLRAEWGLERETARHTRIVSR
ncbi:MAG: AAA family ATPase [Brevundimonas diminuta]|nr:AAA family ATPase [Brevundimonas diminuta]MBD3817795.1 AAA family ATPase [Brevundimonas diminuta]